MTPLEYFHTNLPSKPWSTNSLSDGLFVTPRKSAIKNNYIQADGPTHRRWLIFDVDSKTASIDWYDQHAPTPNIIATNPQNGHAHLFYALQTSVRTADNASLKALKYTAAIEHALRQKLNADAGYSGLICKNPLNQSWIVKEWESELYSLDLLADYLDLNAQPQRQGVVGLGRNCELFDALSKWAMTSIRLSGWPAFEVFFTESLNQALSFNANAFKSQPMTFNEVKAIAKSVASWTCKNVTEQGFSEWQSQQGKKGGKVSKGGGRPSLNEPWKALGISRATYFRKKSAQFKK